MKTNSRTHVGGIECLEARIAPAALLSARVVSYTDPDGDTVRVTISKGSWDLVNDFVFFASGGGEQLRTINLAGKTEFAGASITVVATGPGDGLGHVGLIDATFIDLGTVKIDGDLGRIVVGDTIRKTPALAKLDVHSMGVFGVSTQAPGGTLVTIVSGTLGSLKVAGDIKGAQLTIGATLTSAQIGGDLFGTSDSFGGSLMVTGDIGSVQIGKNITGNGGNFSGRILSGGKIGSVKVGLQVVGGSGQSSAVIHAALGIGSVKIGQGLFGGSGPGSGFISTDQGALGSVVLGEGIFGGTAPGSGGISSGGAIGLMQTGKNGPGLGDVNGGSQANTGTIRALDGIAQILINGTLRGGVGLGSGMIEVTDGRLDKLTITGDFTGADVTDATSVTQSGYILAEDIGSITIGGSILAGNRAGAGTMSKDGEIHSNHAIASLVVGGSIIGGVGNPAIISAVGAVTPTAKSDLAIGEVRVAKGAITGASILAGYEEDRLPRNADAQIGKITVKFDVTRTNIVAGAIAGGDGYFGTNDDASIGSVKDQPNIVSRIASIEIGGVASGDIVSPDAYGFVANEVASVRIKGVKVSLNSGGFNDLGGVLIASTGDVFIREVL